MLISSGEVLGGKWVYRSVDHVVVVVGDIVWACDGCDESCCRSCGNVGVAVQPDIHRIIAESSE